MQTNNIQIRPERSSEFAAIRELVRQSFQHGTTSDGTSEAALIDEIRESPYYIPALSFVAQTKDGEMVGHFMFSKFPLSSTPDGDHMDMERTNIVMLAPVAVEASRQRQGIGTSMLRDGIECVREAGFRGITVEGAHPFYNGVGFRTSSEYGIYATSGIPLREPRCMMCQELYSGALRDIHGYIVYDMYKNA